MLFPPLPATRPAIAPRFGVITITTRQAELAPAFSRACEQVKQAPDVPGSHLADITYSATPDRLTIAGRPPKNTLTITIKHADPQAERTLALHAAGLIVQAVESIPGGPKELNLKIKQKKRRP